MENYLLEQELIPASEGLLLSALLCSVYILHVQLGVAHRVAAWRRRVTHSYTHTIRLWDLLIRLELLPIADGLTVPVKNPVSDKG